MKMRNVMWSLMLVMACSPLYAEGLESITGQGIIQRVGTLVKNVGVVLGSVGLMVALLSASLAFYNQDERAIRYIKGGLVGAFLSFGAYALGIWLTSSFR